LLKLKSGILEESLSGIQQCVNDVTDNFRLNSLVALRFQVAQLFGGLFET
jgi:hypothetical protein